ncbi:hypothetical protein FLK61_31400 [Paenalkalicoccus suaedae]|uniref:Uncharacterized protein n=1 Tax=Paenalkalicoccus suaedae TaxID=2592382 RepID=A0A859FDC8_9BACI|nr:hypothetical protein [Paenalkalicoccus suaedae]QKS71219.1 hypothetical protein FLK61_31400 [Paenalkalicoccus suaedae]
MDRKTMLISILLDSDISDAERDDAAIDLGFISNDDQVEKALLQVANDNHTDDMIKASCGESLAQIWLNEKIVDGEKIYLLKGIAFEEAFALMRKEKENDSAL